MEQTSYKFPSEVVTLPSKGLLYSEDSPLRKGEVEMKYMTAREEDILTNQNLIENGTVIDKLLQSLIVTPINYNDLLLGDKNAILIAARILGYGSDYEFKYKGDRYQIDLTKINEDICYDGINTIDNFNCKNYDFSGGSCLTNKYDDLQLECGITLNPLLSYTNDDIFKRPLDTFVPEIDYPTWFSMFLQIPEFQNFCNWNTSTRNKYSNVCPQSDNNSSVNNCCTLFHINAAAILKWSDHDGPIYSAYGRPGNPKAIKIENLSSMNGQTLLNMSDFRNYQNTYLGTEIPYIIPEFSRILCAGSPIDHFCCPTCNLDSSTYVDPTGLCSCYYGQCGSLPIGDVALDGEVNLKDLYFISEYIYNPNEFYFPVDEECFYFQGDLTGNNQISFSDITHFLSRWRSIQPYCDNPLAQNYGAPCNLAPLNPGITDEILEQECCRIEHEIIDCETVFLPGDVDLSGRVDVLDAVILVQYILEPWSSQITECGFINADANGDGIVNVQDIVVIVNIILNDVRTTSSDDAFLRKILKSLDT